MIDEWPESVLSIAALRTGFGRVWNNAGAMLVESALVPGEPQGFGDPEALLSLLDGARDWTCVEVSDDLASQLAPDFERRFGLRRRVVDVIHTLDRPVDHVGHELVRAVLPGELASLRVDSEDLLPDLDAVRAAAAAAGRVFGAFDGGVLAGHGSSFACGDRSLAVAHALGFKEVASLTFLVRGSP